MPLFLHQVTRFWGARCWGAADYSKASTRSKASTSLWTPALKSCAAIRKITTSNPPNDPPEIIKAALSALAEDYANDRYYEGLVNACDLFLRTKGDRDSRLNKAAMEFIRQCAAKLQQTSDGDDAAKPNIACSFCARSAPEVRLGAGPSVFICNECVGIFHNIL
jgi:ClpX C4-type zinc finger